MPTGTEDYYAQRAPEYDQVYAKPERQADISALADLVKGALARRAVLDIAAGTGFWTERYADAARMTTVCDINGEVLEVARSRRTWRSSHPISRIDEGGNTYQQRSLDDGRQWEVRKDFPSANELRTVLKRYGESVVVTSLTFYWVATFRTPR